MARKKSVQGKVSTSIKPSKEEIQSIRLENFRKLVQEAGSVAELARRCGYSKPIYLYQVNANKPNSKGKVFGIGSHLCAKLEKGMKKPMGWMSKQHTDRQEPIQVFETETPSVALAETVVVNKSQSFANTQVLSNTNLVNAKNSHIKNITVAWTGASGFAYGLRLLECLLKANVCVNLVYSPTVSVVSRQETQFALPENPNEAQQVLCKHFQVTSAQLRVFAQNDWFAPIASGSALIDGMVICPASMGTVAAVAHGLSDSLLERAADVCIKEKRPVVVVPRETPLSPIHLENLLNLARAGCTILPAAPAFYHNPQSVNDIVDFVVARILDHLKIEHNLGKRWGE